MKRKSVLYLEPYEAPKISHLFAVVEQGFVASPSEGAGQDPDGDSDWDQWGDEI